MVSEIFGFLALISFIAVLGRAFWTSWKKYKNSWSFTDHDFEKTPEVINYALRRCLNRGFVNLADRKSEHFVQFRKYILRTGEYGLELGFPRAPWSEAYLPKWRDALTADNIPFRETSESSGDVTEFIHVDCGRDVGKAVDLSRRCFFEIFDCEPNSRFKSSLSDYSTLDEEVADPDYQLPSSLRSWWSAYRAQETAKGHPDPNLLMRGAALMVAFICCFPALWWVWFDSHGAPPDWQWSIGSIRAAGGHATWKLLLIFCVLLVGLRRTVRRIYRGLARKPRTLIERVAWPPLRFALPLAVIASWIGV